MSSVLSLPLKPPFSLYHLHQPRTLSAHRFSLRSHSQSSLSFLKFRIRDSSSSDFDREESRWLREEQRWLREEQRWLREEQRWLREEQRWLREEQRWLREEQRWLREEQRWFRDRDSLLHEISDLKLQIEALELQVSSLGQGGASASETVARVAALLQALKDKNRIAESGTGASPLVLKEIEDKEVVVEEVVRVSKGEAQQKMKTKKERRTLRKGAEGDEVRELQEALQKLGFYSGEEDTEFSSFASGTERAVKTWQSSLDIPEDGIMTAELLRRLYMEQPSEGAGANFSATEKGTNGAALTSITEIEQKVVQEDGVSEHRVFLLGENRWEDSSRLTNRAKHAGKPGGTKCITCRGEGRLLCTECDGTGEPNIEEQFMEWVDEGTKCPYCEGNGYTICDVCHGEVIV